MYFSLKKTNATMKISLWLETSKTVRDKQALTQRRKHGKQKLGDQL